jgi:hypothetical protein
MVAPVITSAPLLATMFEDAGAPASGVVTAVDPEGDLPILWSIVGATTTGASFSYAMTSLRVVKNGATIVLDDFADGVPPPAAPPGFPNNTYVTQGTLTESNGSLILSSTGSVPIGAPGTPDPFVGVGAFLRTNIDPANLTQGLKSNSSFSVEARFLLSSLPDAPREAFTLALSDRIIGGTGTPPDQPGDDVVELRVVQLSSGVLAVRLVDRNFATDQATTLETINLNAPAVADEIAL